MAAVAMVICEEQQVRKSDVETVKEQLGFNLLLRTLAKTSVENHDVTTRCWDVNKQNIPTTNSRLTNDGK